MENISFFIPAYNCEKWLEEAVDSIMETNFEQGDELVIVNDCSTDNTYEVIEKIQKKYNGRNLKVITHKFNMGGPSARNTAIYNSQHNLLFCLDSDNVLEKNSIKSLKDFMLAQNADVASFQEIKFFLDGTPKEQMTHSWIFKEPVFTLQDALSAHKFPSSSGNYMFTKKIWHQVRGFIPHVFGFDNWSFGIRILFNNAKMVVLKNTYYFHRHGMQGDWLNFTENNNTSLVATSILMPYIDRIKKEDANYILNKGRYTWFDNLEKHSIKLKTKKDYENEEKMYKNKTKIVKFLSLFIPKSSWRKKFRNSFAKNQGTN